MINLILLGGMSECGKSHAARHLKDLGFHHQKIIFFEKQAFMKLTNSQEKSVGDDFLRILYSRDHTEVFVCLQNVIEEYCSHNKVTDLVLDSLTRQDMVDYFLFSSLRCLPVFIETDFEKRVDREWAKLGRTIPLQSVKEKVLEKDETKRSRKAEFVKWNSLLITNNGSIQEFEAKLGSIKNYFSDYPFGIWHKNLMFDVRGKKVIKFCNEPLDLQIRRENFMPFKSVAPHFIEMPFVEGPLLEDTIGIRRLSFAAISSLKSLLIGQDKQKTQKDLYYFPRFHLLETSDIFAPYREKLLQIFLKKWNSWFSNCDLHSGNMFDDGTIIDIENSGYSPIVFDLATFFSYEIVHISHRNVIYAPWSDNLAHVFFLLFSSSGATWEELVLLIAFRVWTICAIQNFFSHEERDDIVKKILNANLQLKELLKEIYDFFLRR